MTRATARELALRAIAALTIPRLDLGVGIYQSPTRSRLIAEVPTALGGEGLTRASHLLAFMSAAESVRVNVYTAGASTFFEDPALNLRRGAEALMPAPTALLRPDTVRKVLDLLTKATFEPPPP